MDGSEHSDEFVVVINDEEQFAVQKASASLPPGWRALPVKGQKQACLDYVEEVWVDMTPLSVRQRIAQEYGSPERDG